MAGHDVVETLAEAEALARPPLVVLETLRAFMDRLGLGSGRIAVAPIGAGHSNVTYAIARSDEQFVLRRPPRGPLAASTHDMLREARLLRALASCAVRVPTVLASCEDTAVIGSPFYVMEYLDGHVLERTPPAAIVGNERRVGEQMVDALVELHSVDVKQEAFAAFGRPGSYLERQIGRFRTLLSRNATRPLAELEAVADWLQDNLPPAGSDTVVHGDYRLGNVMFGSGSPPSILALLDWELATIGDPIADVGYLTATWADPDDDPDPMVELSEITRLPGFLRRAQLAERYEELTGRDLSHLRWYQVLALWKGAIFLEGSYQRYLAGTTDDEYFARLAGGVPRLGHRALCQAMAPC